MFAVLATCESVVALDARCIETKKNVSQTHSLHLNYVTVDVLSKGTSSNRETNKIGFFLEY